MDIPLSMIAGPVARRIEPRAFVFLAFDGTRPESSLPWRPLSSGRFSVLFVDAARLLGVTGKHWIKQGFPRRRREPGTKALIWAEVEAARKMAAYYDLIVAATALELGSQADTFNRRHFDPVPGLAVTKPR
jgi:hypothetical protein